MGKYGKAGPIVSRMCAFGTDWGGAWEMESGCLIELGGIGRDFNIQVSLLLVSLQRNKGLVWAGCFPHMSGSIFSSPAFCIFWTPHVRILLAFFRVGTLWRV